jgi:hypothetical protein
MQKKKSNIDKSIPLSAFLLFSLQSGRGESNVEQYNVWKTIGYWRLLMDLQLSMDEAP